MSKKDSALATAAEVARLLQAERVNKDLSMTELAKRSGLSQQMISYVERGMRKPTLDTLLRIAGVLDVDLWKIVKTATDRAGAKTAQRRTKRGTSG